MESFNTGCMTVGVKESRLFAEVSTVELCAKPFLSSVHNMEPITHFYLILISPGLWGRWKRLQLDVTCSSAGGVVTPDVTVTGRDCVPTGTHMIRVLSFPIVGSDITVGHLLQLITDAGLDRATVNAHNAACGRFCFQSLKTFADHGLIRGDWAQDAYEWHDEIGVASEQLGVTVKEEDIMNL